MPSRRKKARALARDSAVTNNFFNQSDPNVCSCCAGPCRHKKAPNKKAPSVTKSTDSDTSKCSVKYALTETNRRTAIETLQAEITSMWKDSLNNLTTEQQEAIRTATRSQTVLDDGLVLKTLRLAHEHINDMAAEAGDEPSSLKTFALDNLKKVAKRYDEVCQEYKSEEKRQMDNLAELLSQLRSIASDTTQSTEDRLAAKLDIHNVNIKRQVIVPLASGLRQVQLFNIEKRFGLAEESYEVLSNDDREKRGEDVPADSSLSVRQKLNSPYKAVEPTPKPRQKKGKKKFNGLQALAEFEDHCKLAIKEIQDSGKTIGKIDESKELQSLTSTSMYADVPVPEVLPDHVRQRFLDAEFAFEEFNKNREMVLQQLHDVNATLVVWQSKSRQVWYVHFKTIAPLRPGIFTATDILIKEAHFAL